MRTRLRTSAENAPGTRCPGSQYSRWRVRNYAANQGANLSPMVDTAETDR